MQELEKTTEEKRVHYLYIKISPKGLYYLGKFTDPKDNSRTVYTYCGSGTYWKKHLSKHNLKHKDIRTIVLHKTFNIEELVTLGLYYSRLFDIVKSKSWANLKEEAGDGGGNFSEETLEKIRQSSLGRKHSEKTKEKLSKISKGKVLTAEDKNKKSLARKGRKQVVTTCPHCSKIGGSEVMKRYHFYNCPELTGHPVDEKVICPHCNKSGNKSNMIRWHFNNCTNLTGIKHKTGKYYPPSEDTLIKFAESSKKPILQFTLDNILLARFDSAAEASRIIGISKTALNNCLKGRSKSCCNFKWFYE